MVPDNRNHPLGSFAELLSNDRVIGGEASGEASMDKLPTKHTRKVTFKKNDKGSDTVDTRFTDRKSRNWNTLAVVVIAVIY